MAARSFECIEPYDCQGAVRVEIETMFMYELPGLENTRSGQDLINKAREEGRLKATHDLLIRIMESRVGELPSDLLRQLQSLDRESSAQLAVNNSTIQSIEDIRRWLLDQSHD